MRTSPRGRRQVPVQVEQQGGFPRPVRADDSHRLPVGDAEGDVPQGGGAVRVDMAQILGLDDMMAHRTSL